MPLDASPAFRARCEHLKQAIDRHGTENAYYLYNAHCVYRLANSEVDGMLRFSFAGTVLTDHSDCRADRADLAIELSGDTCGVTMAPEALAWFRQVIERAVLIEFDRFISAGQLADRVTQLGRVRSLADLPDFAGMNV